ALAAALVCAVCATGRTVHAQPRETLPVDLPTALRLADERNLDIAIALATVDETTARAAQARLLAVPTLRAGSTIDRHHDNIQETSGLVVDVDRASRYTNFGAGLSVDIADAIYRPLAARRIRDASAAAADANRHRVFAQVAIAYLELARANGERTIVQRALDRANDLAALTSDYAEAGEGLPADAEMAAVQPLLLAQRAAATEARLVAASVELGRLLRLEPGVHPMPLDESVPLLT